MSDAAAAKEIASLWEYIDLRTEIDPDDAEEVMSTLESLAARGAGGG
jgi:hypothetical protein